MADRPRGAENRRLARRCVDHWLGVQLLHRTVIHRIQQTDTRHRVRRLINFAGYLVAFLLVAFVVAEEKGHLTIAVGVATAAVAFSLQEVIASIAGWVEISFGRFYQVGDRVELGGIVGDVIDIGVLRTTLFELGQWIGGDQHNGRIVRVANSLVFQGPVFNYSADFPFLWDEITVPVKYGSDRHLARQILQQVIDEIAGPDFPAAQEKRDKLVKRYMIEQLVVEPMVTMTANDNWIEFAVRYVVDYRKRRRTRSLNASWTNSTGVKGGFPLPLRPFSSSVPLCSTSGWERG